jgi:hypothetical protein
MPADQILHEAAKLNKVSENLNTLAELNLPVAEALTGMARTIRTSAILLEVLVALKMERESGHEEPTNQPAEN